MWGQGWPSHDQSDVQTTGECPEVWADAQVHSQPKKFIKMSHCQRSGHYTVQLAFPAQSVQFQSGEKLKAACLQKKIERYEIGRLQVFLGWFALQLSLIVS
jgi:hypothetical protein